MPQDSPTGSHPGSATVPSVVIAAHNEENVIRRCLDALLDQQQPIPFQIVVSANGCTDRTAEVAAGRGVTVVDRAQPGKPGALNAGDEVAIGFPRCYLDADIVVPQGGIAALASKLKSSPQLLAVVPRRRLNTEGRPWLVRSYYAVNERLPVFRHGLFGRGLITLSASGRARFSQFPDMVADDLFLDSQFSDREKAEVEEVVVVIEAPFTTRDLLRRLIRVRRGNATLRLASATGEVAAPIRPADRWAWLRDVVCREPRLVLAGMAYAAITVLAALLARRQPPTGREWGRDESTRAAQPDERSSK